MQFRYLDTPIGRLLLAGDEFGLHLIAFPCGKPINGRPLISNYAPRGLNFSSPCSVHCRTFPMVRPVPTVTSRKSSTGREQ